MQRDCPWRCKESRWCSDGQLEVGFLQGKYQKQRIFGNMVIHIWVSEPEGKPRPLMSPLFNSKRRAKFWAFAVEIPKEREKGFIQYFARKAYSDFPGIQLGLPSPSRIIDEECNRLRNCTVEKLIFPYLLASFHQRVLSISMVCLVKTFVKPDLWITREDLTADRDQVVSIAAADQFRYFLTQRLVGMV